MCESESPRMDDAAGEPVGQEGKVQAAIRICGQWFYNGITTDVPTLQRLLKDAVRSSDALIAKLRKARAQRDTARAELERTVDRDGGLIADITVAVAEAEDLLKVKRPGSLDDRIKRIAEIARRAMHTALVAQAANRTKQVPGSREPAHYLDYALSPEMIALSHGDVLVASTVERLMKQFQAEGHTPRIVVIRVQDFL